MFKRIDGHNSNKDKLFIGSLLYFWIKLGGVILQILFCYISLKILLIGRKDIHQTNEKLKKKIIFIISLCSKVFVLCLDIILTEINIDYIIQKKYLGKKY